MCIHMQYQVALFVDTFELIVFMFYVRTSKSLSWGDDESNILNHLGLNDQKFSIVNSFFLSYR